MLFPCHIKITVLNKKMKTIKTIIIALGFIIINNLNGLSQPKSIIIKGKETLLVKDGSLKITSFTSSDNNGKIVLNWIVVGQKCNGTYMVYRSIDGKNFEIIGIEQSVLVPKKDATYFFNDDNPANSDELYYKIYYFGADNRCYSSSIITIKKT
jgi:hypothetical protein